MQMLLTWSTYLDMVCQWAPMLLMIQSDQIGWWAIGGFSETLFCFVNSDASECRHPKSQFSGSKVIVSGQKMGTSLSSRHGRSFVQTHILGSQKRLLICSKNTFWGARNGSILGSRNEPILGPEMGPSLLILNWGPIYGPKNGPISGPQNEPISGPPKCVFLSK